jgi:protein-tyrosine-phosphatase
MKIFNETMKNIGQKIPINILFACSGNICRSAYAEYIFRRMVGNSAILKDKISVKSAALSIMNETIDSRTKKMLMEEGFSEEKIDQHTPHYIKGNEKLFDEADLIIGFTNQHRLATPKRYKEKFQMISQIVLDKKIAIGDPYWTKTYEEFQEILNRAKELLEELKSMLEERFAQI